MFRKSSFQIDATLGPDLTQLANRGRGDFLLGHVFGEFYLVVGEELWCDTGELGRAWMLPDLSHVLTSRRVNTCALQMHPVFFGHPTPNHARPPGLSQSPRRSSLRACDAGPGLSLSLPKRRASHTEKRSRAFGKEGLGNGKWEMEVYSYDHPPTPGDIRDVTVIGRGPTLHDRVQSRFSPRWAMNVGCGHRCN